MRWLGVKRLIGCDACTAAATLMPRTLMAIHSALLLASHARTADGTNVFAAEDCVVVLQNYHR